MYHTNWVQYRRLCGPTCTSLAAAEEERRRKFGLNTSVCDPLAGETKEKFKTHQGVEFYINFYNKGVVAAIYT